MNKSNRNIDKAKPKRNLVSADFQAWPSKETLWFRHKQTINGCGVTPRFFRRKKKCFHAPHENDIVCTNQSLKIILKRLKELRPIK